jgi:hypothetical protein
MKPTKVKKKEREGGIYEINDFSFEFQREFPQATTDILR